jgi:hypothetical protein
MLQYEEAETTRNDPSQEEAVVSTVEERLSALESEMIVLKRRLADMSKPRPWLDEVAGSMDNWPEFEDVLRLGREFRQSGIDPGDAEAGGG